MLLCGLHGRHRTRVGARLGHAEQEAQEVELPSSAHEREQQRHAAPHHQDGAQEARRAHPGKPQNKG